MNGSHVCLSFTLGMNRDAFALDFHLPAQILLASLALRAPEGRDSRWVEGFVWCYGAGLVLCNIPGYLQLVQFITR